VYSRLIVQYTTLLFILYNFVKGFLVITFLITLFFRTETLTKYGRCIYRVSQKNATQLSNFKFYSRWRKTALVRLPNNAFVSKLNVFRIPPYGPAEDAYPTDRHPRWSTANTVGMRKTKTKINHKKAYEHM